MVGRAKVHGAPVTNGQLIYAPGSTTSTVCAERYAGIGLCMLPRSPDSALNEDSTDVLIAALLPLGPAKTPSLA